MILFTDRHEIGNTPGLDLLRNHDEFLDKMTQASRKIQRLALEKLTLRRWRRRPLALKRWRTRPLASRKR
jgi:hypothetical protein